MYTINFFTLAEIGNDNNTYIENMLNNKLNLSSLDNVKSFLRIYESVYDNLLGFTHGIVITDNRNDKIIYKELFHTDTLFNVIKDEEGNNIYKATGTLEDDCCNYVMVDYLTDKVRVN